MSDSSHAASFQISKDFLLEKQKKPNPISRKWLCINIRSNVNTVLI